MLLKVFDNSLMIFFTLTFLFVLFKILREKLYGDYFGNYLEEPETVLGDVDGDLVIQIYT